MTMNYSSQKKMGAFYTPSFIVDFMVDRVFYHLEKNKRINLNSYSKFKSSILKLHFCDPSIGTGNFLLGLLIYLWKLLKKFDGVTEEEKKKFLKEFTSKNLHGVELNDLALKKCKEKLRYQFPFLNIAFKNLKIGNSLVELDAFEIFSDKEAKQLKPFGWNDEFGRNFKFDVVLGNPPYFNLKKMELVDVNANLLFRYLKQSEYWKEFFRASTDIYYYFIVRALNSIKNDGFLSYIIPNYWIDNKYADIIREKILRNKVVEIIDFGNEKIFKDNGKWIGVSTCITLIQNSKDIGNLDVMRNISKKNIENYLRQKEDLSVKSFQIQQVSLGKEKWVLSPYISILNSIKNNQNLVTLGEISTIIQGMSPGVKDIFVLTDSEVKKHSLEESLLVPFISNKDIKKWTITQEQKKFAILPILADNIENYPNVLQYLNSHKIKLEQGPDRRKLISKGKINWYDFSVYRNLEKFSKTKTKIMCPYRSLNPRFGLDNENSYCATDVYGIITKEDDFLSLLGVLNSDIIRFWFLEAGKRKGRMLEFFSDPLKKIPVPNKETRKSIKPIVKEILKVKSNKISTTVEEKLELEEILNKEVAKMYGLDINKIQRILTKI